MKSLFRFLFVSNFFSRFIHFIHFRRHNCAAFEQQRNRLILDSGGKVKIQQSNADDDAIELPVIIEKTNVDDGESLDFLNESTFDLSDNNRSIEQTTTKRTKLICHKHLDNNNISSDQIVVPINKSDDFKMKSTNDDKQQQSAQENDERSSYSECLINMDEQNQTSLLNRGRQTWKTSPEQVEELTRSLSRIRNDEQGNHRATTTKTYQKSKTKQATKKSNPKETKSKMKDSKRNQQQQQQPQFMMPIRVVSTTRIVNSMTEDDPTPTTTNNNPTATTGFLPPITGFSDTDSSFSSNVCSSGDDCDKIHCICETLKKTHLQEHHHHPHHHDPHHQQPLIDNDYDDYQQQQHQQQYHQSENGINFINIDNTNNNADNWIVVRPKRLRPQDNLRLEGQMELETTFRSTYGRQSVGSDKSKRSINSQNSQQQQLYFNTRRGRHHIGSQPLLRSATNKRKIIRNRPKTCLKTGGHGYWSTNYHDAYKNFTIVDGQAKTVSDSNNRIKLPKVISRTTMMMNEEKNRCKYDLDDNQAATTKPLRMVDGEEIKKFEKKSYVQTSDGQGEMMAEKLVRKVRCGGGGDRPSKSKKNVHHVDDNQDDKANEERIDDQIEREEDPLLQQKQPIMKYRPYDAYQVDHIKDLGLLEMKSNQDNDNQINNDIIRQTDDSNQNYRSHVRRLHETSDDFHILTGGHRINGTIVPLNKPTKTKSQPTTDDQHPMTTMVINGHSVMAGTRKPFILPQRINRHKNESSIPMFDVGDNSDLSYRKNRQGSGQRRQHQQQQPERKRTAGLRTQRSGRRRNLFRQSSDSIFVQQPDSNSNKQNVVEQQSKQPKQNTEIDKKTTYKMEYGDRSLYCPALDVVNNSTNGQTINYPYKKTNEIGGHKYYNTVDK